LSPLAAEPEVEAARLEGCWTDLETRGFVVLRNFLNEDELATQREFLARSEPAPVKVFYAEVASPAALAPIREKVQALLPVISSATKLRLNAVRPDGTYFIAKRAKFGWHSDAMSFFFHQDLYNYLNIWIPLIKPDPDRTGMSVIPMDTLAQRHPEIAAAITGRGDVEINDGVLDVERDGNTTTWQVDAASLGLSPSVRAGDALIVRGDVLHETQDRDTDRVAVSVRAFDLDKKLTKAEFLSMGARKYRRMRLEASFASIGMLGVFWSTGRDEVSVREMLAAKQRLDEREPREVMFHLLAKVLFPVVMWFHRPRS
jgi:hypothetical protein